MPEEEAGTVAFGGAGAGDPRSAGPAQALGLGLRALTELPKATVSRLLHALLEQGWLYRGLTDRRYRLRSAASTVTPPSALPLPGGGAFRAAAGGVERAHRTGRRSVDSRRRPPAGGRKLGARRPAQALPGQPAGGRPARQPVPFGHGQGLPGRTGRQRGAPPGAPAPGRRGPLVARAGPRPGLRPTYRGTLGGRCACRS